MQTLTTADVSVYINSLLFTLNARNKIRVGLKSTNLSFAVPLNYVDAEGRSRHASRAISIRDDIGIPAQANPSTATFPSSSVIDIKFLGDRSPHHADV